MNFWQTNKKNVFNELLQNRNFDYKIIEFWYERNCASVNEYRKYTLNHAKCWYICKSYLFQMLLNQELKPTRSQSHQDMIERNLESHLPRQKQYDIKSKVVTSKALMVLRVHTANYTTNIFIIYYWEWISLGLVTALLTLYQLLQKHDDVTAERWRHEVHARTTHTSRRSARALWEWAPVAGWWRGTWPEETGTLAPGTSVGWSPAIPAELAARVGLRYGLSCVGITYGCPCK